MRCANSGLFSTRFSPMAEVTAVTAVSPDTVLPIFLLSPKNSDNEWNQIMILTENATLLSESAAFALWTHAGGWWVVFRVVAGKLTHYLRFSGAVQECPLSPSFGERAKAVGRNQGRHRKGAAHRLCKNSPKYLLLPIYPSLSQMVAAALALFVVTLGGCLAVMNKGGVPYQISNPDGTAYSMDFETNVQGPVEYFDVYGEVRTQYSQVYPALLLW